MNYLAKGIDPYTKSKYIEDTNEPPMRVPFNDLLFQNNSNADTGELFRSEYAMIDASYVGTLDSEHEEEHEAESTDMPHIQHTSRALRMLACL